MSEVTKKRVCVVGAGAAGLCAARFLAADLDSFDFVVFERNNDIGGTWLYTDNTGLDEYGLPVHSSVYKNMRINIPKEVMNFPDFQKIGENIDDCCVHHEVILKYLNDYVNHFHIKKYVKFNSLVENIRPVVNSHDQTLTWNVTIKNIQNNMESSLDFDAVMICNGHNFVPRVPTIPGSETFPGKMFHSNFYRKPEDFQGKKVLLLGASYSGIDISLDLSRHNAEIYLSHEKSELPHTLPSCVTQVAGVAKIEGNNVTLKDGTTITVDAFIYCTGYLYSFPFLDNDCGIEVDENCVTPLYRYFININYPTMCFIGLENNCLPFVVFHLQAQYFLSFLKGNLKLPSREVMLMDTVLDENQKKKEYHDLNEKQWVYYDSLIKEAQLEALPEFYESGLKTWIVVNRRHTIDCKSFKFVVLEDRKTMKVLDKCGNEVCTDTEISNK